MVKPEVKAKIRTEAFAKIVNENYTTVRNVYGREGREPRQPGPVGRVDFVRGTHRRYVFADAVAWRITRELCALGMVWDNAAEIVRRECIADRVLKDDSGALTDFGVWQVVEDGDVQWAAWAGSMSEIIEIAEHDRARGDVWNVRLISLSQAVDTARYLAEVAGYRVVLRGEFLCAGA
ncbi:hypothetical protein [Paracoccus pantotrophus]|uniref:hypothetical protein n=1 Tax=Paracoccus pantotrophus TaxID=82367 RepID=UPI00048E21CD|nr:hypothetical protein [Paracoccus pantotrophus]